MICEDTGKMLRFHVWKQVGEHNPHTKMVSGRAVPHATVVFAELIEVDQRWNRRFIVVPRLITDYDKRVYVSNWFDIRDKTEIVFGTQKSEMLKNQLQFWRWDHQLLTNRFDFGSLQKSTIRFRFFTLFPGFRILGGKLLLIRAGVPVDCGTDAKYGQRSKSSKLLMCPVQMWLERLFAFWVRTIITTAHLRITSRHVEKNTLNIVGILNKRNF